MAKRGSSESDKFKMPGRKMNTERSGQTVGRETQKAAGTTQSSVPTSAAREVADVPHDMIAQRAYELWRAQGGNDMENWLKAEQELRGQGISAS